jgi:hypothetical protein
VRKHKAKNKKHKKQTTTKQKTQNAKPIFKKMTTNLIQQKKHKTKTFKSTKTTKKQTTFKKEQKRTKQTQNK